MKTFETTVFVLLLAILALQVYTFYKTRESYCPFGNCTPPQPDPSFDPMIENYGFIVTSSPGLPTTVEVVQ